VSLVPQRAELAIDLVPLEPQRARRHRQLAPLLLEPRAPLAEGVHRLPPERRRRLGVAHPLAQVGAHEVGVAGDVGELGGDGRAPRLVGRQLRLQLLAFLAEIAGPDLGRGLDVDDVRREPDHLAFPHHLAAQRARVERRRQPVEGRPRHAPLAARRREPGHLGPIGEHHHRVHLAGRRRRSRDPRRQRDRRPHPADEARLHRW
jgi:hypothetical protein